MTFSHFSEPLYDAQHFERELDDTSLCYTVLSGTDADAAPRDFASFAPALQAYRDARAFMLSRECPPDFELDLLPPSGVMLHVGQLNAMFDDSVPRGYLERNPSGKVATTCGHGRMSAKDEDGRTVCVCLVCNHGWTEYPI